MILVIIVIIIIMISQRDDLLTELATERSFGAASREEYVEDCAILSSLKLSGKANFLRAVNFLLFILLFC